MGYLVPPPPPAIRLLEGDPLRLPLRQGPPLEAPPAGPIPGRPGQPVVVAFDPLGAIGDAICDALVGLLPLPTLPAPLTEEHRDEWPQLYPGEGA